MTDTFTVDELAAYPGVTGSPETLGLVASLINELVSEAMTDNGVTTPAKPAQVKRLALAAAARQLINPEGATTRSIQIDDYKESVTLPDGSVVMGGTGIGFTSDEMGQLVAYLTGKQPMPRSIRLAVPGATDCVDATGYGSDWCPV
jgi:hypothetical protein